MITARMAGGWRGAPPVLPVLVRPVLVRPALVRPALVLPVLVLPVLVLTMLVLAWVWAPAPPAAGQDRVRLAGGIVSTFAGGPGGPALATTVPVAPCGVTSAGGHLLIGDGAGDAVRQVNPLTGWLRTLAGVGPLGSGGGFSGDGGPATAAQLSGPCGAAIDPAGNLIIADTANDRVRVVAARPGTFYGRPMTAGNIYTVAGSGPPAGICGLDDGPGFCPVDVAVDHSGNVVVADTGEADAFNKPALVRVIAGRSGIFYGQQMTAGHMYVVAGGGLSVSGDGGLALRAGLGTMIGQVRIDQAGNLVIADGRVRVVAARAGTFYGITMKALHIYTVAGGGTSLGDGGPATRASVGSAGVAVDGAGNLVIGDTGNDRVRVVAARAGTFYGITRKAHDIYTVAGDGQAGFNGDGGPAVQAKLIVSGAVAVDGADNLVEADGSARARVVAVTSGTFYGRPMTAGDIYTVAGNGSGPGFSGNRGPATSAELGLPGGVVVDGAGNVVIADGRVRVVAAAPGTFYGQTMKAGHIYSVAGGGASLGDGGPATRAELGAQDVTMDRAGNLVIADVSTVRIRVVAVTSGTFYGQRMTAGDIYTVAGTGVGGFSGDGGPATKAEISNYTWVAIGRGGNLVVGDTANLRVRVVAVTSGTFYGQPMSAGDIYTVAGNGSTAFSGDGGPATQAGLNYPGQVAVDRAGNLVIPDSGNDRVRLVAATSGTFYGQVMTTGHIYTVAGNGSSGFSGDGGPATRAELFSPGMVAVDQSGNLLIADRGNNRVRVVAAASGTFYGQVMTTGDIYTIAGNGHIGFTGDGGPATAAEFFGTEGMAINPAGNLLIVDSANHRVRVVTR
ncbi:MAG TPA: hypothetical protein VGS62_09175 [Streptosporangiaceae bacterium]|nr:hypothetical protein [Streptosporangiaceae bacterium]